MLRLTILKYYDSAALKVDWKRRTIK